MLIRLGLKQLPNIDAFSDIDPLIDDAISRLRKSKAIVRLATKVLIRKVIKVMKARKTNGSCQRNNDAPSTILMIKLIYKF